MVINSVVLRNVVVVHASYWLEVDKLALVALMKTSGAYEWQWL